MLFYLLKKGFPEFSPGDGALQGHQYEHGKKYPAENVPPEYLDWFDAVDEKKMAAAGEKGVKAGLELKQKLDEAETDPFVDGEEDIINA